MDGCVVQTVRPERLLLICPFASDLTLKESKVSSILQSQANLKLLEVMALIEFDGQVHTSSMPCPPKPDALVDLHPVAIAPERLSSAAIPLAFLETIERIEINETRVCDGETCFVLDVFLYHFDTRLPANLTSLRQRASVRSTGSGAKAKGRRDRDPTTTTEPDYRVERRLSDFIKLRRRVHQVACMTSYIRCASCEEFAVSTRFQLRQPRSVTMHLLSVFQEMRKKILAAFISDFVALAQCKETQNRKCESHVIVLELIESFVRDVDAEWLSMSQSRSFSWLN